MSNLLSSFRNVSEIIDDVKNKIESCILKYMNFEETVTYLQENHQISHHLIKPIWEQLQRENPDFFNHYHSNCVLACHIKIYNYAFAKQLALMLEVGHIDIVNASPVTRDFILQHHEGTRLLENLANTSVNQLQIPNDQQNQLHHNQFSTSNDLADTGAPNIAPAATALQDSYASQFPGDIGHNCPCFPHLDFDIQMIMHSNDLYAQSQPPLQLQQNFSLQEQQTLEYGGSRNGLQYGGSNNGVHYGEINDQQLYQSTQMYPRVDQQQGQEVILHHPEEHELITVQLPVVSQYRTPESEALNNPDSGNGTLTTAQNQLDLQKQQQQRGL